MRKLLLATLSALAISAGVVATTPAPALRKRLRFP